MASDSRKASSRMDSLDILKGVAILIIVFDHFAWTYPEKLSFGHPFLQNVVPLFLMTSGYLFSMSFVKRRIDTIAGAYSPRLLLKTFTRFTVPFLAVYLIEVLAWIALGALGQETKTPMELLLWVFAGGWGPGSYYYPILVQFIFVFPVIYIVVKRLGVGGLLLVFAANIALEVAGFFFSVPPDFYRLLIYRYLFVIAWGCYWYFYGTKPIHPALWLLAVVGAAFTVAADYLGVDVVLFANWESTSAIGAMLVMPIFAVIANSTYKANRFTKPLVAIGKASYNVYLFQMAYYQFVAPMLYSTIGVSAVSLLIGVAICVSCGYAFYKVEYPATNKLVRRIESGRAS